MTNISPGLYPARSHGDEIADALRYGDGSYSDLRTAAPAPDYVPKHDLAPVFISLAERNAKAALWAQLESAVLALCCMGVGVIFGATVTLYALGRWG